MPTPRKPSPAQKMTAIPKIAEVFSSAACEAFGRTCRTIRAGSLSPDIRAAST